MSSPEFPRFTCLDPGLAGLTPAQQAQRLKYVWRDAAGKTLGTQQMFYLTTMPTFPVSLTVENEFGRTAAASIAQVPTGRTCPRPLYQLAPKPKTWYDRIAPGFGGTLLDWNR